MATDLEGAPALPRWDMTPYFSSLLSREFASEHERLGADVERMEALYDSYDVRRRPSVELTDERVAAFEEVLDDHQRGARTPPSPQLRMSTLSWHTDARDDPAAAVASQLQMQSARVRALSSRFDAWVASLGADAMVERSALAANTPSRCASAERAAAHQMDEGQESLYSELSLTASTAWNRLHGDFTSLLMAEVEGIDGSSQKPSR